MADPILEFDPAAEASGSPLTITTGNYGFISFTAPAPPAKAQWASSVDTEGSVLASSGHENRTITIQLEVVGDAALATLQGKVAKAHREGATLKYTDAAGASVVFDVRIQDGWERQFDHLHYLGGVTQVQFSLTCAPYSRAAATTGSDWIETTGTALIATETGIAGDVEALGEWTVDNDGAQDWWGFLWGSETNREYTFTDSTGSGALLYQAESRTAMGGSAIAAGPTGASGSGSNVMRNTSLANSHQAMLSTQATGGGAHLSHVGLFRVLARVQVPATNTGTVSVAFEYAVGDFRRPIPNRTVSIDPALEGVWLVVDLDLVVIDKVPTGTHRWEGRILARSTVAGDDIDIDCIALIPANAASGMAKAVATTPTPTSFSARDEFDQAAGALNAKTLPVGGAWATSGTAGDYSVSGTGILSRTSASDSSGGRHALAGTATFTNVDVSVDHTAAVDNLFSKSGLLLRYVDSSNYLAVVATSSGRIQVRKVIAAVTTVLASVTASVTGYDGTSYRTLRARVDTNGRYWVWQATQGISGRLIVSGADSALATGGTLATGKVGIIDEWTAATSSTRNYDTFWAAVLPADAAVFAGQSLTVRYDSVVREDSGGSFWQRVSDYTGHYLRVLPAGAEGHSTRFLARPLYHPESNGVWVDDRIDDLSARLTSTSRFL